MIYKQEVGEMSLDYIVFAIVLLNLNLVKADFYSSVEQYEALVESHSIFIKNIKEFLYDEDRRLNIIRKFLRVYKSEQKSIESIPDYLNHPVNAFKFVKRLTADLTIIQHLIKTAAKLQVDEELAYPNRDDVEGAAIGIARVQDTYNLDIEDLASGVIRGHFSHGNKLYFERVTPMSSTDCYEIARALYKRKFLFESIQWWKQALHKYRRKARDDGYPIDDVTLVRHIRDAYDELGDLRNAVTWTKELLTIKPNATESKNLMNYQKQIAYEKLWNKEIISEQIHNHPKTFTKEQLNAIPAVDQNDYKALCRGEQQKFENSLTCYYQTGLHPLLRLARVKTELLHRDPDVILYRDVISDAEIRHLQKIAKHKMERVGVGEKPTNFEGRITKSVNLFEDVSAVVARVSQRIALLTNLSLESAEPFQIINYGIGGYYRPHFDYFGPQLIGLSYVEQGGATVFTRANLTVFPEKGAALFWWNLRHCGEYDYRTEHAGCPVLRGSKWILTNWLHVEGQELRRLCLAKDTQNYTTWENFAYFFGVL